MALTDYTPTDWQNGESGGTPLDADHLNKIEQGLKQLNDRLTASESITDVTSQLTLHETASNVQLHATLIGNQWLHLTLLVGNETPDSLHIKDWGSITLAQLPSTIHVTQSARTYIWFDGFPGTSITFGADLEGQITIYARGAGGVQPVIVQGAVAYVTIPVTVNS